MRKSQHPVSRNTTPASGNRLKPGLAFIVAIAAAGFAVFEASTDKSMDFSKQLAGFECSAGDKSCSGNSVDVKEAAIAGPVRGIFDNPGTEDEVQDDSVNSTVAEADQRTSSDLARPGSTVAELCATSLESSNYYCRTEPDDAIFQAAGADADTDAVSGHTISGRVLTTEGRGVAGVKIVAAAERLNDKLDFRRSGTPRFWTMSDALGAYSLDGLPDGEYTIRTSTHGPYQSARISARAGVGYADIVVARNTEAVVEGRVFGSEGEPLEGVTVLPYLLGQASVLTGDDGRFRLPVTLNPTIDAFALRYQRPGYEEQISKVALGRVGHASESFVEVIMHPVESWTTLEGTVYSDTGDTLAGRTVELRPRLTQRTYKTITDRDGKYSFPIVEAPANYQLIVFGGADHKDHEQRLRMTVDTTELDIVVESYEFGEVSGQLVNANGEPIPNFDLVFRNTSSRKPNSVVSTDDYGNFKILSAPAGDFVLASQSTPSILVQGLHLWADERLHLPLVLDWGQHEIRGLVIDSQGNPVPASRIVLHWSHHEGGITTRATRRTAADTQGHFAFSNLGPGPHLLQINASGFSPVDMDHDLSLQGYEVTVKLN